MFRNTSCDEFPYGSPLSSSIAIVRARIFDSMSPAQAKLVNIIKSAAATVIRLPNFAMRYRPNIEFDPVLCDQSDRAPPLGLVRSASDKIRLQPETHRVRHSASATRDVSPAVWRQ